LWHLSGQNLNTMLVLVQNVGPLDLVSSLVISLMWVPPLVLLTGHALGLLYQVSVRQVRATWLARTVDRTPDWVVVLTVMWAALTWQLRFLPALSMVALMILGLTIRKRHPGWPRRNIGIWCLVPPIVVAVVVYVFFASAIVDAFAGGEVALALLLSLPPILTLALTGPVPAHHAWAVTHPLAAVAALVGPFLLIVIFLRTPVLPSVALQLEPAGEATPEVVLGYAVSIDDTMTTLLDNTGSVRFVPNASVAAKVLCGGAEQIPHSVVDAHGWHVETSLLGLFLPNREPPRTDDIRCAGRPR
jgi:hypothetical protein